MSAQPGDDRLDPAWYLRLCPDNAPDYTLRITLQPPLRPHDPRSHVMFDVSLTRPPFAYLMGVLDSRGQELPEFRIIGDGYKRNQNLPDDNPDKIKLPAPDEFKLVPMTLADVLPGSSYRLPEMGSQLP